MRYRARNTAFTASLAVGLALLSHSPARAADLTDVEFLVVDPASHRPIPNARIEIRDLSGNRLPAVLATRADLPGHTTAFNAATWSAASANAGARLIVLPLGKTVSLHGQAQQGTPPAGAPPVRDIYIKVTATRAVQSASATGTGVQISKQQRQTFGNSESGSAAALTKGQSGVATDSNGQAHIRGEHTDITYVVDGIPLPDTLSGRSSSIVIPSTIDSLEILTGGYAPEFGEQTAAVLNITTVPGARKPHTDVQFQGGSYNTVNGDLTFTGPIGTRASYVVDISAARTALAQDPQQPSDPTAHNTGADETFFGKFRYTPSRKDTLNLTVSQAPATTQLNNRTGLPDSYADVGQGYGFLGLRDSNGVRPDLTVTTPGALGSQILPLLSQQAMGQDITQREVNEFAVLSWRHQMSSKDVGLLGITVLHSGQDVDNHNPAANPLSLPVDSSIEYSPTAHRNVHHVQIVGSVDLPRNQHEIKAGFITDDQSGNETYQLVPGSQLALDELAALDQALAPDGSVLTANGSPVLDVDGAPVYKASSSISPVLTVHRAGFYRGAYGQDTWRTGRLVFNYGLRFDWFRQTQNLGQAIVDTTALSPRLNFEYTLNRRTVARWSYNRLFNTPPLAQGAVVGQPIVPETLNQYDISIERKTAQNQMAKLAYYVKDIRNQVDVGLLVPGSQIGLFSGVTFEDGGIHGIEASYDIYPKRGQGMDAYLNYTYSIARPNGLDNTGAPVPVYNDHDQRNTIGLGLAYLWKNAATVATTISYGSGLASSIVIPGGPRTPRTEVDMHFATSNRFFHGKGGLALDVQNLLDAQTVINFQSAFSGTRFMSPTQVILSAFGSF
jgi:outer membrane receptor protein involved in Fe transport